MTALNRYKSVIVCAVHNDWKGLVIGMRKRFLQIALLVMVIGVGCSGCSSVDKHRAATTAGTVDFEVVVPNEIEPTEVQIDAQGVPALETVESTESEESVVIETENSSSASEAYEEDTAPEDVAEKLETDASSEEAAETTDSTEADIPETTSEVTTESSTEETTEESTETNLATETSVEQTTEEAVEEVFVAYDPNYIVALCNEKIKAYGKILIWENLDNLLAEGKITQEEYDEYYPFDGMENSYYSVFVETDLNKASTISGRPLRTEEEIADYIVGMLALENGDVVAVSYAGVYEGNHYDFCEFRCHR